MFDIRFICDDDVVSGLTLEPTGSHEQCVCLGQIVLGQFCERFETPLGYWGKSDYQRQWYGALSRIVAGAEKTALLTAMNDPALANFLTWWPVYQDNQTVFVQNQLLLLDGLKEPFSIEMMDEFVAPHTTVSPDGYAISEWPVLVSDIEKFLVRCPCPS